LLFYKSRDGSSVVVSGLIAATDRLVQFPESGRTGPEFEDTAVREVIRPPYRIVYRLVGADQIHVLTVHHSSKSFPAKL
jgi:toxin ParE1/3/4